MSPSGPCPHTGMLRVWEASSGQCVHAQRQLPGPGQELTHCTLARAAGLLLSVTADHNLLLYEARSLQLQKQVSKCCPCSAHSPGCHPSTHTGPGLCPSRPHSLPATVRRCWTSGSSGPRIPTLWWPLTAPA